jgi:iron complex transport system ATP-binding protein
MLQVNNYSSSILHNISLNITQNTIILGANGSGKSTLAKVIVGIIPNNNVQIMGKTHEQLSAKEKIQYINYIPSKLEVFDEYMSVQEFLELSFIQTPTYTVKELAKLFGLSSLLEHNCQTLSSGESQLLLMASSLAHNAAITILDEPTSNLDQKKTKRVFDILNSHNHLKHKIIITHDLNFAFKLGFDIVFIKKGEIAFHGSSGEFFEPVMMEKFFGKSVKIVENFVVSNL